MNWKLYTAITTIPKNIIAGRTATGPANTSNSETITILNPQEELAAANTEIKQLQELLEARDTPILNNKSLNTQRLATVLKALS